MTLLADEPVTTQGRLPDFFIVGHPKCGTTALYETLRSHPEIFMPGVKEPWFFAPELRPNGRYREPAGRPDTLQEYVSLFADAEPKQRVGEATPSYLRSHGAAERIAAQQPDARIIAILREPASFIRSFHLQLVQNHAETETDLRRALALEPARRAGAEIPARCPTAQTLFYSDHVHYVEQLGRYSSAFAEDQLLVLIYDDFRDDNLATVGRVLRFLGLDDTRPLQPSHANPSVRVRSRRLDTLMRSLYRGEGATSGAAKAAIKALTPASVRHRTVRGAQRRVVYADPLPPDEALMLDLRRRFRGEVQALSDHLGRDLIGLWGYDGIE